MNPCPRPISTRTIVLPDMVERRTLFVFCPRLGRAVSLEQGCAECAKCDGVATSNDASRRPSVLCSFEGNGVQALAQPVGAVLARHAICVRADAVGAVRGVCLQAGNVAVVDEEARLVGTMDPSGRVLSDDGASAILEETSIAGALRRMALRHWRSAPVVARSGTVVGVVDDVDALRALTALAAL